jgi:hypothetical protein
MTAGNESCQHLLKLRDTPTACGVWCGVSTPGIAVSSDVAGKSFQDSLWEHEKAHLTVAPALCTTVRNAHFSALGTFQTKNRFAVMV